MIECQWYHSANSAAPDVLYQQERGCLLCSLSRVALLYGLMTHARSARSFSVCKEQQMSDLETLPVPSSLSNRWHHLDPTKDAKELMKALLPGPHYLMTCWQPSLTFPYSCHGSCCELSFMMVLPNITLPTHPPLGV